MSNWMAAETLMMWGGMLVLGVVLAGVYRWIFTRKK